jgi:hypothetical protein
MPSDSGNADDPSGQSVLLRQFLADLMRNDPFRRYGAHGVGIGRKEVAGVRTQRLAVRFHVVAKAPLSQLPPERQIPPSFRFRPPGEEQEVDVPTDVIESPSPRLHVDLESEVRPVPGGVSVSSSVSFGTGTVGGWVWDNTDDTIVMLSNQHVFGNAAGGVIIQPGTADGGVFPASRIGQVKRSVPIVPLGDGRATPDDCNLVDAAVGDADSAELFDLTVVDVGPAVYLTDDPAEGLQVEKTGQTTGHTLGEITDVPYNAPIPDYPEGEAVMCDCFRVVPVDEDTLWASNGDSGSIVFLVSGDTFQPALGLHFAGGGTPPHNWGLACKMQNVFAALDLGRLCDGGFEAFLDALYPEEGAGGGDDRAMLGSPTSFTTREQRRRRSRRLHSGLSRDVHRRLLATQRGRRLTETVARHRGELLSLLVSDGDVRRATVSALRPILKGATTTTSVLARRLSQQDVRRLEHLAQEVARKGSPQLRQAIESLRTLGEGAQGRSLAEVFEITL